MLITPQKSPKNKARTCAPSDGVVLLLFVCLLFLGTRAFFTAAFEEREGRFFCETDFFAFVVVVETPVLFVFLTREDVRFLGDLR